MKSTENRTHRYKVIVKMPDRDYEFRIMASSLGEAIKQVKASPVWKLGETHVTLDDRPLDE